MQTNSPVFETKPFFYTLPTIDRAEIEQYDNVSVVDFDVDRKLDLFNYKHCDNSSPTTVKNSRGVVFSLNDIVFQGFPYSVELEVTDRKEIHDILSDMSNVAFFDSHEGAIIRMFYRDGWFVSTHRKLNAFKSRWGDDAKSFGKLFQDAIFAEKSMNSNFRRWLASNGSANNNAWENFLAALDKNKSYLFLVLNDERSRIVCTPPRRSTVYHVGTVSDNKMHMTDTSLHLPKPDRRFFDNPEKVLDYVSGMDWTKLQGLLICDIEGNHYKIFAPGYSTRFALRGNVPSLTLRYLQICDSPQKTQEFIDLYPEFNQKSLEIQDTVYAIAQKLHRFYLRKHIPDPTGRRDRTIPNIPKTMYFIIPKCHEWYRTGAATARERGTKPERVTIEVVFTMIKNQSPYSIWRMLRDANEFLNNVN